VTVGDIKQVYYYCNPRSAVKSQACCSKFVFVRANHTDNTACVIIDKAIEAIHAPMTDLRQWYDNLNPNYRARSADNLRWAVTYLIIAATVNGFFATHGYIVIESMEVIKILSTLFLGLTTFIFLRQIKPAGAQDIQALVVMLILPTPDFNYTCIAELMPQVELACRWFKPTRLLAIVPLIFICYEMPWGLIQGCNIMAPPTKDGATVIDTADGIYKLCSYDSYYGGGRLYALFREVEITPGISFVKRLDHGSYCYKPILQRTPDNQYVIVPSPKENLNIYAN